MMHSGSFLQSEPWEQCNRVIGSQTWRVQGVLVIKVDARRGAFLLVPHVSMYSKTLHEGLVRLARQEGCVFIRACPLMIDMLENRQIFHNLGFRRAPIHQHPEFAWILDIRPDEETLLAAMRKTTRYSIKKAQKDGIATEISTDPADLERFWMLYDITAKRQRFVPFSKQLLNAEFRAFEQNAYWVLAEHAAAMVVTTDTEAFYHHGASMHHPTASYLVQWEAIREAKRRGFEFYNFWGVWPDDRARAQTGLSHFKRGFGGFEEAYVPAQDFVLSPRYWVVYAIEKARAWKRNY